MEEKIAATAEIITYKGAKILFSDFSGLTDQELTNALKSVSRAMMPKLKDKKDWLSVGLFTNCRFNESASRVLIQMHKGMIDSFVAIAEVGLNATQQKGLELVHSVARSNVPLKFFQDADEAKDWTVEVYRKKNTNPQA
jgi:hypothetical protein